MHVIGRHYSHVFPDIDFSFEAVLILNCNFSFHFYSETFHFPFCLIIQFNAGF